ncbi:MAG: hypothetical protein ACI9YP_000975 [Colwellia sp.]|jgi:hypothetical protein
MRINSIIHSLSYKEKLAVNYCNKTIKINKCGSSGKIFSLITQSLYLPPYHYK